jgi:hypothetical protein
MGDFLLGEEINFSWAGGSLDPIPENRAVNETFVLARHGKQFRLRSQTRHWVGQIELEAPLSYCLA